jgi:hypothetical protein
MEQENGDVLEKMNENNDFQRMTHVQQEIKRRKLQHKNNSS